MRLTKDYLRKLILESLHENEDKFADQVDIENPDIAKLKDSAYLLDDYMSREGTTPDLEAYLQFLVTKIKDSDPEWELGSQRQ